MTELQTSVWEFLRQRFAGPQNAAPRETILARYNLLHHADLSDRLFRQIVSDLVTLYKKAICTTPHRGYFVAQTVAEKNEALNYLDSVIGEVAERRRALAEADPLERQERLF